MIIISFVKKYFLRKFNHLRLLIIDKIILELQIECILKIYYKFFAKTSSLILKTSLNYNQNFYIF